MTYFERRYPPPLVALFMMAMMWVLARYSPTLSVPNGVTVSLTVACVLLAITILALALNAFRTHKTTINPHRVDKASTLVSTGVFNLTRNPMYLGMALLVLAWALYLSAPLAVLGPVAFVMYIKRFQILPEERALIAKFGETYTAYCGRVRRWI